MSDTIHQYVSKRIKGKNQRFAVLVARKQSNNVVYTGFAQCAIKRKDKFDKDLGMAIANGRILERIYTQKPYEVPHSIKKDMKHFHERCKKYFKTSAVM